MRLTDVQKEELKEDLVSCLGLETEIQKIVIFGSFLNSYNTNDIDVAVFQESTDEYLTLAMKYRKKTRTVSKIIPLDIFPVKLSVDNDPFLTEIAAGEVIYER